VTSSPLPKMLLIVYEPPADKRASRFENERASEGSSDTIVTWFTASLVPS